MNKQKFEAYLRDKLSILQEEEIDEILAEYIQHIDMRVAEGVSEEEAIADFGDLDELVNDLLDAYKINRNERDFAKFENRVKLGLNQIMDFINRVANSIMKRSSNEVVSLIVEFIIVIFAVYLVNQFIESIFGGFYGAFYFRPYFLTNLIRLLIGLIRIVLTTSVSLAIFYWFAKERVLRNEDETDGEKEMKNKKETVKPEVKVQSKKADMSMKEEETLVVSSEAIEETDNVVESTIIEEQEEIVEVIEPEVIDADEKLYEKTVEPQSQAKPIDIPKPKKQRSFMQRIMSFNVLIIRVIAAFFLIPGIVIGVFMGIGYGMLLFATISGYGSLGLSLLFAGILLIYYYVTIVLIKFVGGKKA